MAIKHHLVYSDDISREIENPYLADLHERLFKNRYQNKTEMVESSMQSVTTLDPNEKQLIQKLLFDENQKIKTSYKVLIGGISKKINHYLF